MQLNLFKRGYKKKKEASNLMSIKIAHLKNLNKPSKIYMILHLGDLWKTRIPRLIRKTIITVMSEELLTNSLETSLGPTTTAMSPKNSQFTCKKSNRAKVSSCFQRSDNIVENNRPWVNSKTNI